MNQLADDPRITASDLLHKKKEWLAEINALKQVEQTDDKKDIPIDNDHIGNQLASVAGNLANGFQ